MLSLPQLLNSSMATEVPFMSFSIFDAIVSTVLINLLMFWKENKLRRTHIVKKNLKWACHAVV